MALPKASRDEQQQQQVQLRAGFRILIDEATNEISYDDGALVVVETYPGYRMNLTTGFADEEPGWTTLKYDYSSAELGELGFRSSERLYYALFKNAVDTLLGIWYKDANGVPAFRHTSQPPKPGAGDRVQLYASVPDDKVVGLRIAPVEVVPESVYTAGTGIAISSTGVISATGSSGTGGGTGRDLLDMTPAFLESVMALSYDVNGDATPSDSPTGSYPGQWFNAIDAQGNSFRYECGRYRYQAGVPTTAGLGPAWSRQLRLQP
jgi:hypothetical protein